MHAKPQAIKTVSIPWTILTVVYVILITMLKLMEAAKKLVKKLYQIVLNIAQKLQITWYVQSVFLDMHYLQMLVLLQVALIIAKR